MARDTGQASGGDELNAQHPGGSRVAVTDGSTIRVLDRTGREVASFANGAGIVIGSIAWGEDGIVFVDQSNGVLRVIQP